VKSLCCTFTKLSLKQTYLDLIKNYVVVLLENVADHMKDKLVDLRNNSISHVFETNTICDFWLKVSDDYPNVVKALK